MQGGNRKEKAAVGPGQLDDYDLAALWAAGEDVRSLKSLILFGLKGMAAYAYHARALGRTDPAVNAFSMRHSRPSAQRKRLTSCWRWC